MMLKKKNLRVTSDATARASRAATSCSCLGVVCKVLRVVCVLIHLQVGVLLVVFERTLRSQKWSVRFKMGRCGGDESVVRGKRR